MADGGFTSLWWSLRTLGFFIYAYIQVEVLSHNSELKSIILDFYENGIKELTAPPVDDDLNMVERPKPKDGMKLLPYHGVPSWPQPLGSSLISLSHRFSTQPMFFWQRASSKTI
jgi:hypothetical protein